MKHAWQAAAIVILAGVAFGTPAFGADTFGDPRDIEIPELNRIQVPDPDRVVLDNGMVIYFLEDHDFPVVDVRAIIRVGSIYEPAGQIGLAEITGNVMRTGGSEQTDGDELDEVLEALGASVEVSIGQTQGTATVSTLSGDLDQGLRVLSGILRQPAFPEDKIDLAKKQQRTAIAARNDEPLGILQRELPKLIYGADHPYARHTEYATIEAITRDDLVRFHRAYFHPDRMIFTVYGDFSTGEVKQLMEEIFGDWTQAQTPLPPDPPVEPTAVEGLFVIDKANATNSLVVLGHEGIRMDSPDYAALQVAHEVAGGGFAGRLINEIRSKRGLAYATGSSSGAGMHHPGAQIFYVITQTDSTTSTLGYLEDEVEKLISAPPTDEELQRAKDSILNSLVFTLSSKGAVLNRLASYEFYGYPQDFLTTYQQQVQEVTADEVLAAAQRNIRYPQAATLIVGERINFETGLASLGGYTEIDITIPEPAGEAMPEAGEADFARGQEIMAGAAQAHGGEALAAVQDVKVVEEGTFAVQGMEFQVTTTSLERMPDCVWSEIKLPVATIVQAACGETAWMSTPQGTQEMPADMRASMEDQRERDLLHLLRNFSDLQLQALPEPAALEGGPADVLFVHSDHVQGWKVYVDQASRRVVKMDFRDEAPGTGAPVDAELFLGDYRPVQGVQMPHTRRILHDGEVLADLTAREIAINEGVDTAIFEMP